MLVTDTQTHRNQEKQSAFTFGQQVIIFSNMAHLSSWLSRFNLNSPADVGANNPLSIK